MVDFVTYTRLNTVDNRVGEWICRWRGFDYLMMGADDGETKQRATLLRCVHTSVVGHRPTSVEIVDLTLQTA